MHHRFLDIRIYQLVKFYGNLHTNDDSNEVLEESPHQNTIEKIGELVGALHSSLFTFYGLKPR